MTNSWQYKSVIIKNEHVKDQLIQSVHEVNGQNAGFRDENGSQCFHELHEYLELMGREGWEAVGVSPMNISSTGFISSILVLLKRPGGK